MRGGGPLCSGLPRPLGARSSFPLRGCVFGPPTQESAGAATFVSGGLGNAKETHSMDRQGGEGPLL
jgi:hypothetical protein